MAQNQPYPKNTIEAPRGQFLNEENYNRANQKLKKASLIILILGILLGGGFIAYGTIKTDEANKLNEQRAADAAKETETKQTAAQQRLSDIASEQATLEAEHEAKQQECDSLDMQASDWLANRNKCDREASDIQAKINNLSVEQFELSNSKQTTIYNLEKPEKYYVFYFIGAFCIISSLMASLAIFLITKRRSILAYSAQSVMPVGKEAVEQYTPTIAKAAGDIAESVSEGIAKGVSKNKHNT